MAKLNLQPRDRRVLAIGAIVLLVWGVYLGAQGPIKKYQLSKKNVTEARDRIKKLRTFEADIESDRSGQTAFKTVAAARPRGFDLFVYLKNLSDTDLKGRADLKVQSNATLGGAYSQVQLTMNGVAIDEVVNFLHKVYASKNLIAVPQVDYLRLTRDQKGLECRLTFVSPRA
ncbi:MAG: type II secretion system protein M [Candidatus Hydrogenedentes bacterium]|nr:type II secretion system protein M [Candidatus Hydrogenedentota bacterium]